MQSIYTVRLPKDEDERNRAVMYAAQNMFNTYKSNPAPEKTPPDLFVAVKDEKVVGTLAIEFGAPDRVLPFEELFEFDATRLPFQYERERIIYYSRWNSSEKGLGPVLWLAASQYAIDHGAVWSASIGKEPRYQYLKEKLGCIWHPIPDAKMVRDRIAVNDQNYFFSDPAPYPCLAVIKDQIKELPVLVSKICEEKNIIISL